MSSIGGVGGSRSDLDIHLGEPEATTSPAASAAAAAASRTSSAGAVTSRPASGASAAATNVLERIPVGTMPGSGTVVTLDPATGKFRAKPASGRAESAAASLYRAAELVATGNAGFLTDPKLGAAGRLKLAQELEAGLKQGNGASGTPRVTDLKARTGAATIALTMAKGLPDGDPVKGRLIAAYVAQMGVEGQRGLKASMAMNLEDAVKQGKVKLTSAQQAELAKSLEACLPARPPYEDWFKNGNEKLNVRHYIHEEFFESDARDYETLGFKKTVVAPGHYKYEKTYTDPASGRKMPVTVECFKTGESGGRDRVGMDKIFSDMDDPNVQIELYGGHSNLGGNVIGGIANGPNVQKGSKWAINWMCRGQQVLADVYNKYPDAHYMTTNQPVYANGPGLLDTIFKGAAGRQTYAQMERNFSSDWQAQKLWFPNNPAVLTARDIDKDGQVDRSVLGGVDPLWNVGIKESANEVRDLKPVATTKTPQDLPGAKIMRGVNFANTFLTYHKEHVNDGRLPELGDKIAAGGWFADPASDEVCRIKEKKVGGETYYEVQVNTKYANQETNALGAAILYELNRHVSKEKNGSYTEQDKLRGAVMAGEFCAYMADSYEQVDDIMRAVATHYAFPSKLTWDNVNKAIDKDDHGYATPTQVNELKKIIGSVDPNKG